MLLATDATLDTVPALARKLAQQRPLGGEDLDHLRRVLGLSVATHGNRVPLIEQGDAATGVQIVLDGWACSYRRGPNGRRQITAFHVPGDVCDFNVLLTSAADLSVEALEGLRVARLSRGTLNLLAQQHPAITRGLWWESAASASVQREWMVSLGQRNARQRIAHLMCELFTRLRVVDLVEGDSAAVPLTQADIGDACGMTPEHTNRTLRELRDGGLCMLQDRRLTIPDWWKLVDCAGFDPAYLHFSRETERHVRARADASQSEAEPLISVLAEAAGARVRSS